MSASIKGTMGVLLAAALALQGTVLAATLTVSGTPRQVSTLQQGYPAFACMDPVANGGAGSYRWDFASNPGNHFTIDATYGTVVPVVPIAAGDYPITLRVTDANGDTATLSVSVSVVSTPVVSLTKDTIRDNYNGSSWFCAMGIYAPGFLCNDKNVTTWTLGDPSGYFAIDNIYNVLFFRSVPPIGDYPIQVSLTQSGQPLGPFDFTIHVVPSQKITSIDFVQTTVSTSEIAGCAAGTASAIVWEPGYKWSIPAAGSDGGTFTILNSATGAVTLAKSPAAGDRNITITVQDGLNSYSQDFVVHVVEGTTLPAGNMSMTVASNLDNYTSSGSVGTPAVTGIPGTKFWSFTGDGVGNRYTINAQTGEVTVIGPLSYQPTLDGVDYSDVITISCTDGINTCTNSFRIPVAACVGPVLNVGPGQTYPHLDDAIAYCVTNRWGRPFAGVTFNVYPSDDPNYYLNDGQRAKGIFPVPVTIQGAPGQRFPKFHGGNLYYAKGFFLANSYDMWIKNIEICNVTDGSNSSSSDNLSGVCKEGSVATGNVFLDNFYIHDCQNGVNRGGSYGTKWFITNGRVSHCGIGQTGATHNLYLLGSFAYLNNVLSDQSTIGHVFKTRCVKNIIRNCRFYDGELGHGSIVADFPEGGVDTITNTVIQKGPNWQNEFAVHFANSADNWSSHAANSMSISGCSLFADAWQPSRVTATVDFSLAAADGTPASMTMTDNSFYGFVPANYMTVGSNPSGATGIASISGSTALTAQPPLDWSFPGPGPDPTIDSPPGPFLAPYGVIGGPQITLPVNEIRVDAAAPVGSPVVQPTWLPGNSGATSPAWSLRKNPGGRYAIDPATGAITTAAALVPGSVDVLEIDVAQPPIQFWQWYGGQTYYDHPTDGSFIHSIYVVVSGNLPPNYTITASAGAGGSISPRGEVVMNPDSSQTFTITANPGYVIDSVVVDGSSVGAVSSYTFSSITTNHTISVTFNAVPTVTIAVSADSGGMIYPSGSIVLNASTSQTFTIAACTGHTIADVLVDGVSVGVVSTYTFSSVTTDHTITASFSVVGSGGTAPVMVDFETAGQEGLFTTINTYSWTRVAGHDGYMGRIVTGNTPAWTVYAPGGVSYPVGMDTISGDVDLTYSGSPGSYAGGLVLQQKSTSEQYMARLSAHAGTITLSVGNFNYWGSGTTGHSGIQSLQIATYTEGSTAFDLGWYNIKAVVSAVNGDQYQAVVTVTKPDTTTVTLTYVDSGPARYLTAYPAGFYASSQFRAPINVDNFRIGSDLAAPSIPQMGMVTAATAQLLSLGSQNAPTTDYLVQEATTGLYVDVTGRLQASPIWQARQAWSGTIIRGLASATTYQFQSKARSAAGTEGSYGPPTSVTTTAAGDIDGDGYVNLADLKILVAAWNSQVAGADAKWNPAADLDGDNNVNLSDLKILVAHWNRQ